MKTKYVVTCLVAIMVFAQAQFAFAQTMDKALDSWKLLGTREVDFTIDRDVISLKENTNITGLKFIVKQGTVIMHKATVHFTNGDTQNIEFPEQVTKANDGRVCELKGNSRKVEKVTFWYDTKNSSKEKAVVEVWGK